MIFAPEILKRIGYAATLGEESLFSALDFACRHGFGAVEVNLNVPAFFPEQYTNEERLALRKKVEETGLALSFHAPEDIPLHHLHREVREAGLKRLKECIDFAAQVGGRKITFHSGDSVCFTQVDRKIYLQDVYASQFASLLRESYAALREHARGKILPCIENVGNFSKTVRDCLNELLPEGGLYLTWDIGHSFGKPEQEEFFIQNLAYVRNCHVHDHNGTQDHQVIGTGRVNFSRYFNLLKETDASFIIEVRPVEKALLSYENLRRMHGRNQGSGSRDQE